MSWAGWQAAQWQRRPPTRFAQLSCGQALRMAARSAFSFTTAARCVSSPHRPPLDLPALSTVVCAIRVLEHDGVGTCCGRILTTKPQHLI